MTEATSPGDPVAASRAPGVRATYRLQLRSGFGFREAEAIVPYLAALGVSHVYCSPYLRARSGSAHGYDITDHGRLNPEIGDEEDLARFVATLRRHGMGQILDFVPNHMGVAMADNTWWLDVLRYGPASPWAEFFDIDWRPPSPELRGKVLAPFLGDHYGRVLESGDLVLRFEARTGSFDVWYHQHRFPVSPRAAAHLLEDALARLRARLGPDDAACVALERIVADLGEPFPPTASARRRAERRQRAESARDDLARLVTGTPALGEAVEAACAAVAGEPGRAESWRRLHRLLEDQHYRLAFWRVASDEINYRRFFNVNELAALRMERRDVFDATHGRLLEWLREGALDGLRLDHVDGLYDPKGYAERLRAAAEGCPFYLVVEKILAHHESLRSDWPVDGTTGYEFLGLVGGLFVDPAGEVALDETWQAFAAGAPSLDEEVYACKKHVMNFLLGGELAVLSHALNRLSEAHWSTRDFTETSLREALKEVTACFPVYRSYVTSEGAAPEDRRDIEWALAQARRRSSDPEPSLFDWIEAVLLGDVAMGPRSGWPRREALRFAMRFQQFSGPVMAKALEDTAFYRQHRLASLNEVGGEPGRFGTSVAAFHHVNGERQRRWPRSMLTTATHDTKRGEDTRLRIHAISERASEWAERVARWRPWNQRWKREVDGGEAPAPEDEYLLYQTLLGSWPEADGRTPDGDTPWLDSWRARLESYAVKALREAKKRSSWRHPRLEYEEAHLSFLRALLAVDRANPFLADLATFAARVAPVAAVHSLAQVALKLAAPGVPDTYQGGELWDLSLADPDNRRPVDFARRAAALVASAQDGPALRQALVEGWLDGRVKLFVTARALALRRRRSALFEQGEYVPIAPEGAQAERVVALARRAGTARIAVVAPRCVTPLLPDGAGIRIPAEAWGDTRVALPAADGGTTTPWRDVLTGARHEGAAEGTSVAALFRELPVAVLESEEDG